MKMPWYRTPSRTITRIPAPIKPGTRWLDNSTEPPIMKVWNGENWMRAEPPTEAPIPTMKCGCGGVMIYTNKIDEKLESTCVVCRCTITLTPGPIIKV